MFKKEINLLKSLEQEVEIRTSQFISDKIRFGRLLCYWTLRAKTPEFYEINGVKLMIQEFGT